MQHNSFLGIQLENEPYAEFLTLKKIKNYNTKLELACSRRNNVQVDTKKKKFHIEPSDLTHRT
jgi:hypothetical protein